MNTEVNTTVTTNLSHLKRFTAGLNHQKLLTGADDQNNKVSVNICLDNRLCGQKKNSRT
jgi:hypothetical protein